MEEVNEIVNKFIASLDDNLKDNILLVIAYGSRILKNNRDDSDLDILIVIEGLNNYRIGKIINGVRCDCTIYGVNRIYEVLEEKNNANNRYFESVFNYGYVIKDKRGLVNFIKDYIDGIEYVYTARKLTSTILNDLKTCYEEFLENNSDYNYYNLLEKIRTAYHYQKRYSYIGLTKVPKIYQDGILYEENYRLKLPPSNFRKLFLEAIDRDEFRDEVVDELLGYLNLPTDFNEYFPYYKKNYHTNDDIKYMLVIFYNRINELERLLVINEKTFLYIFYITVRQLYDFCSDTQILDENVNTLFCSIEGYENNTEKFKLFLHILTLIGTNYHFDYDDYMVKLKR